MFYKGWKGVFAAVDLRGATSAREGGITSTVLGETAIYHTATGASPIATAGGGGDRSSGNVGGEEKDTGSGTSPEGDSVIDEVGKIIDEANNRQNANEEPVRADAREEQVEPQRTDGRGAEQKVFRRDIIIIQFLR